ncbi:chemotaxis protein CheA [Candidatus Nitronereus thalassa]|uniref:Chemotaxis protein CheA n=1 Tax=Candidatus Nitronereus thalassa TaxID=3020898 RepID=A0ABU3K670_9BACT|nr:chemotaxis protein CheA [Candidatus Nitronereus thalassa]MDT7041895.1 chemotaxis protein CheA [Candidatus Nitronereus thalassa]
MSIDFSRFQETFFVESAEHVETMETGLLDLEQRADDLDLLNRIFRAAHSIKGNAGMFGFTAIGELTHKMENVLDRLRNQEMVATQGTIDVLLRSLDALKSLLDAAQGGASFDPEIIKPIEDELVACQMGEQADSSPQATSSAPSRPSGPTHLCVDWVPLSELFQRGLDPSRIIKDLAELGEVLEVGVKTNRVPALAVMDPEVCYLAWQIRMETDKSVRELDAVFDFVRDGSELVITEQPVSTFVSQETKRVGEILVDEGALTQAQLEESLNKQRRIGEILVEDKVVAPQQVAQALQKQQDSVSRVKKSEAASIRVDTEKIDKLINLVGELVITQSMITDLGERFTLDQLPILQERVLQLERNTRELQERVMSIRMLPIGTAFQRFPRLVRDLASKSGKQIQLVMSGEETELDKTVIEAIGDPLTHLVRNSADHGLELPEDRKAEGKSELGTIRLNAYQEGGSICITVEDDGRGLNREKILKKAVANGVISEGETLPDDQVWQLIFRPGFSTAEKITDVSGRGVGMDVVKRNIEALGGAVTIQTQEGKGSRLMLKLPLTLAIMDGMTVRVGEEQYIIPLLSVTETIQPKRSELQTMAGRGEVVGLRGEWLPVLRLYEAFQVTPVVTDPCQALLVIVESEGKRVAVLVDELVGQQQVVIKSLEQNYQKVGGIAGATILGDGHVALIVDVQGLVSHSLNGQSVAA